ncbi:MAG: MerR family DNA-binding transcriptional regulator [Rhodospirillales bacterium]|nr:MerR family DNA-binding transcriptional regulator [Rhodospirillales bacterium]
MILCSIADLSRASGATPRTLRFWESEGLIQPKREGQRRLYDQRARTRVKLIQRGQRLGFSLAEIREIVDLYDAPAEEAAQLSLLLARIAARRRQLEAKRADIEETLAELESVAAVCKERLVNLEGDAQ